MPKRNEPEIQGPEAFLRAITESPNSLREKYKNDPLGLADRLGIQLPKKPLQVMQELGLYDLGKHGPISPGIRDLVYDLCTLQITDAVVVSNRGGGKALSIYTPIPTPDGWTTMGDLKVGDQVFDEQGQPCRVLEVSRIRNNRPCYEVVFNDGSSVVADEDHLWFTSTAVSRHADRYANGKRWWSKRVSFASTKTTKEILETISISAGNGRRDFHHQILNSKPLELPPLDLPIDPYVLGMWLGDGDTSGGYITVDYRECDQLVNKIRRRGYTVVVLSRTGGHKSVRVRGLTTLLRQAGLLNNKHVPDSYLRSSISQRRELLAGLMDSDGTTRANNNNCQFTNCIENLSDGVYELVCSLGWKATKYKKIGKLNGVHHKPVHGVSFRPTKQIFRNPRKAERINLSVGQASRHLNRVIKEVRPIPSVPVKCIVVDSPSHLFLCGEQMVPTHNSKVAAFIEFFFVFILGFDALNLGGSELQAEAVYNYILGYIEQDEEWKRLIKGDPQKEKTFTTDGNWIRVLTASSKSVRSPHAGGRGRDGKPKGGILVIDEEAEAEAEIVGAALSTINTARPSVSLRVSTFHNATGSFADLVDNHVEMGYCLFGWNIFDVADRCGCTGSECQSPEPCFREDHFVEVTDPDTGKLEKRLLHKSYCGGRARYADGWIPVVEIEKLWKRMKRNHAQFEVEAMGSRPSTSGHVIKDLQAYNNNIIKAKGAELYIPGFPIVICIDWGVIACGIEVWQAQDKHTLIHAEQLLESSQTETFNKILNLWNLYFADAQEVAADIGGGGNYLNPKLREEAGIPVRDVRFNEEKEAAVAVWNMINEAHQVQYPEEFVEFHQQVRNWKRRSTDGRISKGKDHLCDAGVCYFSGMIDVMGMSHIRILPKTFHAGPTAPAPQQSGGMVAQPTRPLIRSIGPRRR